MARPSPRTLILAGPTRTGTTSLFRFLAEEPRVTPSLRKETNFFLPHAYGQAPAPGASYAACFSPGERALRLEASPLYFLGGARVARAIRDQVEDVRVVFTLREPVARFVSLYKHIVSKRAPSVPLAFADFVHSTLAFAPDRFDGLAQLNQLAFHEGCYAELLAEWVGVLGADRVKVLFYDALAAAGTRAWLPELLAWAGLPDSPLCHAPFLHENKGLEVRSSSAQQVAMWMNARLEPLLTRRRALRQALRTLYYALNRPKPSSAFPPAALAELSAAYRRRNAGLDRLLASLGVAAPPGWAVGA
jgi:hypothetical protein